MPNNYFKFKQFIIYQDNAAMKVGTDGVLLGAWTKGKNPKRILDIGTGTGLLALMLAQKYNANIDAIDIEETAIKDATNNVNLSIWKENITVYQKSLQEFSQSTNNKYDLIISNPPFFANSLKAKGENRINARHTDSLTPEDLFKNTKMIISPTGIFSIIIPTENFENYKCISKENSFYINRILWVKPTPTKPAKRVLLVFSLVQTELEEDTLITEKYGRHKYSEEFKELLREYYLNF